MFWSGQLSLVSKLEQYIICAVKQVLFALGYTADSGVNAVLACKPCLICCCTAVATALQGEHTH